MTIWLLGELDDTDLQWLAVSLQSRAMEVEYVLPDELMIGSSLTCRIDDRAGPDRGLSSSVRLRDGRTISDDMHGLVVNRLTGIPPIGGVASPADSAYLAEEWQASLVAWLRSLRCSVLNPPRGTSLAGPPQLMPAAWRRIASAHGLTALPWSSTRAAGAEPSSATDVSEVICVATHCFPLTPQRSPPPPVAQALPAMARFVGAPLLGATFAHHQGEWTFLEATTHPRLAAAGERLVDAVVEQARQVLP